VNPSFVPAKVNLAFTLTDQARFGWVQDREAGYQAALVLAEQAQSSDPDYGLVYSARSYALTFTRRHEEAIAAAEKAVSLSPSDATVCHMSAMTHIYAGNFRLAREYEQQAVRLSPLELNVFRIDHARALFHLNIYGEAIGISEAVLKVMPDWITAKTILLASLWRAGKEKEANSVASGIIEEHPQFSVSRWSRGFPYQNSEDLADLMSPLLQTGLPE
jgi:adenylate cyclase